MNHFLESWADPHARHAMLVHAPIMLVMLGAPLALAGAVLALREDALARGVRLAALTCFIVASVGAFVAAQAGHEAADALQTHQPPLLENEKAAVDVHRSRGSVAWMWPLIPTVFLGLARCCNRGRPRAALWVLASVAGIGVAAWYGVIAHAGGRLVYSHGLGVPVRQSLIVQPGAQAAVNPTPTAIGAGRRDPAAGPR